jgi:hypothetical protein
MEEKKTPVYMERVARYLATERHTANLFSLRGRSEFIEAVYQPA